MARRRAPLAAAALLLSGAAAATEVPGLGPVDPRRPVPFAEPPWNSIALVETLPGGRCTGVAIGPRLVLTAAHCLVTADGRGIVPPAEVAVRLGAAVARGVSLTIGPGFDPVREEPWRADWAMVTLDAPVGQGRTLPLLREAPANGAPLSLPAWQHDRPDVLLADRGCRVVMVGTFGAQGILVGHNCAGTVGSSGAPILLPVSGGYAIAGVQVKAALGQPLGLAVPAFTIPLPAAPSAPSPASREGRAAPPPSRR